MRFPACAEQITVAVPTKAFICAKFHAIEPYLSYMVNQAVMPIRDMNDLGEQIRAMPGSGGARSEKPAIRRMKAVLPAGQQILQGRVELKDGQRLAIHAAGAKGE